MGNGLESRWGSCQGRLYFGVDYVESRKENVEEWRRIDPDRRWVVNRGSV